MSRPPSEGLIRCPAVRSLVKTGAVHDQDLQSASVEELVHAVSGHAQNLGPDEPGSIGNVAGFFAIFNHGIPAHLLFNRLHDAWDGAKVAAGKNTQRRFDLRLFQSRGDHPGTVNFFKNDPEGEFQAAQFDHEMDELSEGGMLTMRGIAKLIIKANGGAWDERGNVIDLAKSSGEWALMVCALRGDNSATSIAVADLRALYSEADTRQLLDGCRNASARDWVKVTAQIATAIAAEKGAKLSAIARKLHSAYGWINHGGETLCPCKRCSPEVYETENRA